MATIKSIEEKAKAYDKAIKRVEDIEAGKCQKPFVFTEGLFDYIFPELKESEDERIRKALYKMAKVPRKEIYEAEGITKEQALAWLEKQGKQKETLCDKCKKTQPSHSCQDITALGRCALEKQGEQKPQGKSALEAINEEKIDNANKVEPKQEKLTEFEKAVKQVMEEAIECGDTRNLKADAEMLLSLVHKSAWSEDDELHIRELESLVKQVWTTAEHENDKDTIHKMSDLSFFLKTLKPQPKQEWSEEDKKKVNNLYVLLDQMVRFNILSDKDATEFKNWLKYLKERVQLQSTWEPSDEQINTLEYYMHTLICNKHKEILFGLYTDLKKLKG